MLKRRLEDLSFKYLRPDIYNQIDHWLDTHQVVEKHIIDKVVDLIRDLLTSNAIEGQVYGRIKHKYSIYKKMQSQSLTLDEMHDIMAFRVLVKDIKDCYAVRPSTAWPRTGSTKKRGASTARIWNSSPGSGRFLNVRGKRRIPGSSCIP